MNQDPRQRADDQPTPTDPDAAPDDSEPSFFASDEHDGWGPIVKRRPTEPPTER